MQFDELPDVMTVVEAAEFLRIGRTLGYQLAQRFQESDGVEGLPVVAVGRNLRVPKVQLAKVLSGEIRLIGPSAGEAPNTQPETDRRKARTRRRATQLSLLDPESA